LFIFASFYGRGRFFSSSAEKEPQLESLDSAEKIDKKDNKTNSLYISQSLVNIKAALVKTVFCDKMDKR